MDALAYVLDGLERELELERELGVRSVEIDRSLLSVAPNPASPAPPPPVAAPAAPAVGAAPAEAREARPCKKLVFVHNRPLSDGGREMVAKIMAALKLDSAEVPVVVAPPLPPAEAYVVFGGLALRKFFPGLPEAPGQRLAAPGGGRLLVTNSPEYILRFKTVTPSVMEMKRKMWSDIKTFCQLNSMER